MKLHFSLDNLSDIRNPVVTTGSFDGVHIGHKVIISRLVKLAKDINGETVLITFYPHPRRILYPNAEGKDLLMILSQKEKFKLLEKTGLDHLVIITFTKEFSRISSHDFVEKILVDRLHACVVVVGFNHHFGHNREGNFDYLYGLSRQYGFEVEEIPEQEIQNESVSSTKIRKALLEGNIQRANAYLDHYYIITGRLSYNIENSEMLSIPVYSLNIEEDVKLVPTDGIYAVSIAEDGLYFKGMTFIRDWMIVNNKLSPSLTIDIHIFDQSFKSAGNAVTVYFQKRIREGADMNNINKFRIQLKTVKSEIEELIY